MYKLLNNNKLMVLLVLSVLFALFITMSANLKTDNQVTNISAQQVGDLIESEAGLIIIDVRELHEFQEGHIPGALLIPLGLLQQNITTIDADRPIILVCRSGNRSMQAAQFFLKEGFTNIYNLSGGMKDWPYDITTDVIKCY
ncbi:rhodanese-related sulfurtransferase [Desulfitispora alkaliphila]|uniref:rhodanese-like domain-containing protein n=1 Tax=Desulfitispora alkaliphila TaxID=622674 RepID=UPI003D1A4D5B